MRVNGGATRFLRELGSSKLEVVSIFGNARQGKSFLMNELSRQRVFPVSSKSEPCTVGIDLSTTTTTVAELRGAPSSKAGLFSSMFSRGGGREASDADADATKIAFADAEGQGDQKTAYDATLVTPTLLVARVVLFNTKEAPLKDKILQQLGVLVRAADGVRTGARRDEDLLLEGGCCFGHLILVFRDWTFEDADAGRVERQIFDEERTSAAAERDAIRRKLKAAFASIDVALLPPPVDNLRTLGGHRAGVIEVTPDFRAAVDSLRTSVCDKLAPTRVRAAAGKKKPVTTLTAMRLAKLVPAYVEALNSKGVVVPDSAYAEIVKAELRVDADELEKDAKATLEKNNDATDLDDVCDALKKHQHQQQRKKTQHSPPLVEDVLGPTLDSIIAEAKKEFDLKVRARGDDVTAAPVREVASSLEAKLEALKGSALELRVRRLFAKAESQARHQKEHLLDVTGAKARLQAAIAALDDFDLDRKIFLAASNDDDDVDEVLPPASIRLPTKAQFSAAVDRALRAEAAGIRADFKARRRQGEGPDDDDQSVYGLLRTKLFVHEQVVAERTADLSRSDLARLDEAVEEVAAAAKDAFAAKRARVAREVADRDEARRAKKRENDAKARLRTLEEERDKLERAQRDRLEAMRREQALEERRLRELKQERADLDRKLKEDEAKKEDQDAAAAQDAAASSKTSKRKAPTRSAKEKTKKPKLSKEDALKEARAAMARRAEDIIDDHHKGTRGGSTL